VDLLVTRLDASTGPELASECVPFLALDAAELQRAAKNGGAAKVEVYGNYRRDEYVREHSADLVLIAIK